MLALAPVVIQHHKRGYTKSPFKKWPCVELRSARSCWCCRSVTWPNRPGSCGSSVVFGLQKVQKETLPHEIYSQAWIPYLRESTYQQHGGRGPSTMFWAINIGGNAVLHVSLSCSNEGRQGAGHDRAMLSLHALWFELHVHVVTFNYKCILSQNSLILKPIVGKLVSEHVRSFLGVVWHIVWSLSESYICLCLRFLKKSQQWHNDYIVPTKDNLGNSISIHTRASCTPHSWCIYPATSYTSWAMECPWVKGWIIARHLTVRQLIVQYVWSYMYVHTMDQ